MKSDLKGWTLDNISNEICSNHGFFDNVVIQKTYDEHLVNGVNNEHKLWSIIQFNQWYLKYKKYITN